MDQFRLSIHFLNGVMRTVRRKKWYLSKIHIRFNNRLAGKTKMEFIIPRHPVNSWTGTTDTAPTTGPT